MQIQSTTQLTQLGNSDAVIIPAPIVREAKYKRGQKFTIDYIPQTNGILVRPVEKKGKTTKQSDKEFQNWLTMVLEEDKDLLDELSRR